MRTCKICHEPYTPKYTTTQATCNKTECMIQYGREKQQKAHSKEFRKKQRQAKDKLKTRSDWLREAQTAFNAYIRERDKYEHCISCGRQPRKRNAGHYKSVGSSPELRFHPFNCNLQCEHCNTYKSGNQTEYRIHLVRRIGLANVEWLEGPHSAQKLTIDEIKEIKQYYKEQLKILKNT